MTAAELRSAIGRLVDPAPAHELEASARAISARYRAGETPYVRTAGDALAYVATRLPATEAAGRSAMQQVASQWPAFRPRRQLDLGAGPGAAAWAAAAVWPSLETAVLCERDPQMLALAEELAAARFSWEFEQADLVEFAGPELAGHELPTADLVTVCYVLGELEPADAVLAAKRAWDMTAGCLLLLEPGTPAGFALVRRLRQELLEAGAHLVAPCPAEGPCPVPGGDWCHFSARLDRSAAHRSLKVAERSFEDEKFSYVAFARGDAEAVRAPGRVLRRPRRRRHFMELVVCAGDSIVTVGVGRSQPAYRAARRLSWGDAAPAELSSSGAPGSA